MQDLTHLIRKFEFIAYGKGKRRTIGMVEAITEKAILVSYFDKFPDEYIRRAWIPKSMIFCHDTKYYLATGHRLFHASLNPKFKPKMLFERLPQERIDHLRNIFYGESYPRTLEAVKYRDQYEVGGGRRILQILTRFLKRWRMRRGSAQATRGRALPVVR